MKQYKFSVYFVGSGEEIVMAFCIRDAIILACAERIKKGYNIFATSCKNWDLNTVISLNSENPAVIVNL